MDPDRVRDLVAAIPPGAWMSYGDVARAAGGADVHARALNQRFIREQTPGAHRVLKSDGSVGGTALGDPAAVALRRLADRLENAEVERALRDGWTWSLVAEALGVTRQAVHKKHARRLKAAGVDIGRR